MPLRKLTAYNFPRTIYRRQYIAHNSQQLLFISPAVHSPMCVWQYMGKEDIVKYELTISTKTLY